MPTSPAKARSSPPRWRSRTSRPPSKGINVEIVSADHQNKPDVASNDRPPVVRPGGRRRHRRRADLLGGAGRERHHQREEQGLHQLRRRLVGSHRRQVLAQHRPLDLRHLGARQRHRQARWSSRAARTGSSSPPTTPSATRWSATRRRSSRRPAARWSAPSATPSRAPTSRPSCCRRSPRAPQVIGLANAGGDTINSIKQAAEFGITQGGQSLAGLLDLHHRRACARPRDRAGPGADRELLLGPERPDARMVEALRRDARRRQADHGAGRRLCRRAALPEGGRGDRRQGHRRRSWPR